MKRVAVKRKKANSGAKRNAPRRRASVKSTTAPKIRSATKRKARAKSSAGSSRRIAAKPKTVVRRSQRRTSPKRAATIRPGLPKTPPSAAIDLSNLTDGSPSPSPRKAAPRSPARRKSPAQPAHFEIPPILLEGDEPESPTASGPGEKFSLGPQTPAAHFATSPTHLPASYGTGRLFLAARDPHWIYAYWDIEATVQFQHNARSVDRHLILRMHERDLSGKPVTEIHVHPESRHWFAHVERAGERYVADLGYYQAGRKWKSLATSRTVRTPPDSIAPDAKVEFATIPAEVPFETMLSLLEEGEGQSAPLAHAVERLRERRRREFPPAPPPGQWTPEQERALTEILTAGRAHREVPGSPEITAPTGEGLPGDFAILGLPSSFEEYVSSPLGGGAHAGHEFWFKVNAELTICGSTEPNAKVSIGGREVPLRPDGSFSFRFALPDGEHDLPMVAVSADGTDARFAELKFSRTTKTLGDVGAQPQDPSLKPPAPDNI
jgi:hypothetical protein